MRGLSSWCLRVSLKSTSAHQCPACACGQETTLRAPRWRSSRASAPHKKVQTASAADWRPPKNGEQEDDGRPDHPQGGRRPRDGRRWDTDEATREAGPVQAIAVTLHDDTGQGLPSRAHPALTLLYFAACEDAVAGPERADACSSGWLFAWLSGCERMLMGAQLTCSRVTPRHNAAFPLLFPHPRP